MNPVEDRHAGFCEWPVHSYFWAKESKSCGRPATGRYVRLCWQHSDNAWAQLFDDLYTHPSGRISSLLADWFRSVAVNEHDSAEQAEERTQGRRAAVLSVSRAIEYGGIDNVPDFIAEALEEGIDRLIEKRLAAQWGATA